MKTLTKTTVKDFNKAFCKFHEAIGNKHHTNDQIKGGFKALTLCYLNLNASREEVEQCASTLQIAIQGAEARGWNLTD